MSNKGGVRPGAGRKKGSPNKRKKSAEDYYTGRIVISCLPAEEEAIKRKAQEEGKTVSRYIVDAILK